MLCYKCCNPFSTFTEETDLCSFHFFKRMSQFFGKCFTFPVLAIQDLGNRKIEYFSWWLIWNYVDFEEFFCGKSKSRLVHTIHCFQFCISKFPPFSWARLPSVFLVSIRFCGNLYCFVIFLHFYELCGHTFPKNRKKFPGNMHLSRKHSVSYFNIFGLFHHVFQQNTKRISGKIYFLASSVTAFLLVFLVSLCFVFFSPV